MFDSSDRPLTGEEYSVPTEQSKGYLSSLAEEMDSQLRNGAMFAAFRVNHTGSVNESFSNSVVESAIGQQINSASSSMASTRFSLADGSENDVPAFLRRRKRNKKNQE
jgi:hypothetical protein